MIRRNQILEIDVDEHGGLTSGATSHENPYADIRPCGFLNLRRLSELFNRLRMHFHGSIPWLEFGRASACVPSRWKVLSGEFRRRPTALAIKFRKPDHVGRRGLSEPREDFSRLPTNAWTQKWFVQFFGSGLIRNRAQTCCALKSSAPFGARQDNCADLLGLQTRRGSNHSAAHVGESNSRSNVFQISCTSVCVPSRWKVLSGEFRRPPDGTCNKISQIRSCRSPRTV